MRTAQLQRVNFLWFITLGVTALAAGILVYLLLIESALGAFSIREASPISLGVDHRPTIFLLENDPSRNAYNQLYENGVGAARYDTSLAAWERILDQRGPAVKIDSLDSSVLREDDVLILPSSLALSNRDVDSIRVFVEQGGSLLISWAAALYDNGLNWRGWSFIDSTFGVQFEEFVEPGSSDYRTSRQTYRADPLAGIYLPQYRFDAIEDAHFASLSLENADVKRDMQRLAKAKEFAPLGGYVWFDTLQSLPHGFDYASVSTLDDTDGNATDSVSVEFRTWIGEAATLGPAYPRTQASTRRFTFRGGTALTAGIPGGYRAKVRVYNPGVSLRVTNPDRAVSAGFWHDFAQEDPGDQNIRKPSTGLVYGSYGRGRFVFMGFSPDALDASFQDPEDQQIMDRLFENVIRFLRREPIVWTHDWPYANDAAVMIAPIISADADGVASLLQVLSEENIPATFFIDSESASAQAALTRRLVAHGEIALFDPVKNSTSRTVAVEQERIGELQNALSAVIGQSVLGYRSARRGALDDVTMQALTQSGFTYFLPDSIGRRTTPKIMGAPFESLSRIGRTTRFEKAEILANDSLSSEQKVSQMLREAYRVLGEGGVYVLSPSSSLFTDDQQSEVFRSFLRRLKQENLWFATGSEVAHWWRLRKGLNADVEQRSDSRIFVRLSNDNGDTAEQATLSISLEREVSSVIIRPELINILKPVPDEIDVPPYMLRDSGTVLDLSIRQLNPQQYRIFHVDLISKELQDRFAGN